MLEIGCDVAQQSAEVCRVCRVSLGQSVLSHQLIEGRGYVVTHTTHKLNLRFIKPSAV